MKTAWERVRQGSTAHKILITTERLTGELERGVRVGEIRDGFREDHDGDLPSSLTATIHNMKSRGVLEVVGGRASHTLLALAGSGLAGVERSDDGLLLVLEALTVRFHSVGMAISTRGVHQQLRLLHPNLELSTENTVRKHLETLSMARIRGPASFREPMVIRVDAERETGVAAAYWIPAAAGEGAAVGTAPRSAADAIRRAVRAMDTHMWRPVSATELRWWADVPEHWKMTGNKIKRNRLAQALSDTARSDARHASTVGRIEEIRTRYTCHGGAPPRYWSQVPDDETTRALCLLSDLAQVLMTADEVAGFARLRNRNLRLRREILAEIWLDRADLLCTLIQQAKGDLDADQVEDWLKRASYQQYRWLDQAVLSASQRESRLADIDTAHRNLIHLVGILNWDLNRGPNWSGSVGEKAVVTLDELDPLLELACRAMGIPPGRSSKQGLVKRARRLPLQNAEPKNHLTDPGGAPLSGLDRVDALVAVWELFPVPAANMLMDAAHAVLGHVLRDNTTVHQYLAELDEADAWSRQALTVALGLLGHAPPAEEVMQNSGSYEDATAWVFSVVLEDWSAAADRIRDLGGSFRGPAARVAQTAVRRLESGHPFSVVG